MPVPTNVTTAQQEAQTAQTAADQYASGQFTIGDVLKEKTLDYYKNNQDVVSQLDVARTGYTNAPSEARVKYQDIFNPFARENLVSQYTGTKLLPVLALSSILGQRFGRIEDTIGAGTRAYQAQSATALANAQNKRQAAQDALNQWVQEETFRLREAEINKPAAGSTSPFAGLTEFLKYVRGGGGGTTPANNLDSFWEDKITMDDLNDRQREEVLRRSATSNKSLDQLVEEVYKEQSQTPTLTGTYGAGGVPETGMNIQGSNIDWSKVRF